MEFTSYPTDFVLDMLFALGNATRNFLHECLIWHNHLCGFAFDHENSICEAGTSSSA
jgi:hypothetical protein